MRFVERKWSGHFWVSELMGLKWLAEKSKTRQRLGSGMYKTRITGALS